MEEVFSIRPFAVGDQEQAHILILEGFGERFGYIDKTLNPDLDDILHNYIIRGHVFLVAHIGQLLVGTGALISHSEGTSEMVRISTHKDYRRRGIGRSVINSLIKAACMRGDRRIIVKTNVDWYDAIHLYKCLGFVEYRRTIGAVNLELLLDE